MNRTTALVLLAVGCSPAATPPPQTSEPPTPAPVSATSTSSSMPEPTPPPPPEPAASSEISVSTAMPMEGGLAAEALVTALNERMGPLGACVELIRKTDGVVGSLNVQVTISVDGRVEADLQSPVNSEAERCLLEGMRAWRLPGLGEGKAMVLLSLGETAPSASVSTPERDPCPPVSAPPKYTDCYAFELTGSPPCESICRKPRRAASTRCCVEPQHSVVLSGNTELLSLATCRFVPPECAHRHGHGNMDSELRVLTGSPPEVMVVEGGCEMRAMAHGYVPPGVPAWAGCKRQTYTWDGHKFVKQ